MGRERGRGRETYMENSDTCHVHKYMFRLGMCIVCMHACIAIVYTFVHTPGAFQLPAVTFTVMYSQVNVNHSLVRRVTYHLLSALHSLVPFKEG